MDLERASARLWQEIEAADIPNSIWVECFLACDSRVSRARHWYTEVKSLDTLLDAEPLAAQINVLGTGSLTTWFEGVLIYVQLNEGRFFVRVAGDEVTLDAITEKLQDRIPKLELPPDEVSFRFWMAADGYPRSIPKVLKCPPWDDVTRNYAGTTREDLDALMLRYAPSNSGLLVLWYGPPGTGKTWAIQSLAREWKPWADFHLVCDPEVFFNDSYYMLKVMMASDNDDRWRVLVLEDTGELLTADAKMRTGQGLSRLLNLTDGLLGRGNKTLVLMTSNEDLQTFHPAVTRTGRCAAQVLFEEFPRAQAEAWFADEGASSPPGSGSIALADMYGHLRGAALGEPRQFGFSPR